MGIISLQRGEEEQFVIVVKQGAAPAEIQQQIDSVIGPGNVVVIDTTDPAYIAQEAERAAAREAALQEERRRSSDLRRQLTAASEWVTKSGGPYADLLLEALEAYDGLLNGDYRDYDY